MTLIVYRDGTLYADDKFVVEPKGYQQRLTTGPKLFMTPGRRAAVAILGQGFSPEDRPLAIEWLEYAVVHVARSQMGAKDLPEFQDMPHLFNDGETSFLILTKKKIYHYKKVGQLMVLHDETHHCYGTGAGPFNVCMSAGMEIEEAYAAVNKVVWTVGTLANKISRDELLEIKPWKKYTDEELDAILDRRYIDSGHDRWVDEGGRYHVRY